MIVAGGGVGLSGAEEALVELAERLDAPVLTTPAGRGSISEDHRLAFGLVGLYRTASSARPLDEADAVLLVGTRMEEFQSGQLAVFPRGAQASSRSTSTPSRSAGTSGRTSRLVGDARLVLEQLAAACDAERRALRAHRGAAAFRDACEREVEEECAPAGTS